MWVCELSGKQERYFGRYHIDGAGGGRPEFRPAKINPSTIRFPL